ncbi:MAG: helix-turn-helix domain-containing protein [Methylocystis sp.]|uniref:helix-turn-helix domain-containing protein n=1 Tax=Methylocystis sp. TaxID=1911079 RepID=UPI003DA4F313
MSAVSTVRKAWRVPEAAKAWGVSVPSVYRWIAQRRVRTIKMGGCTAIPDEEVARIASEGLPAAA